MVEHNLKRLTVLKHCYGCHRDATTHELRCSCGAPLITVVFSSLTGERITEDGTERIRGHVHYAELEGRYRSGLASGEVSNAPMGRVNGSVLELRKDEGGSN
jgi:hypothetical protein